MKDKNVCFGQIDFKIINIYIGKVSENKMQKILVSSGEVMLWKAKIK
jgi:hypothetical protein